VALQHVIVYAEGLSLTVDCIAGDYELLEALFTAGRRIEGTLPDEFMRFGVEYSDGVKATNVPTGGFDDVPDALLLRNGGGGAEGKSTWKYWLWPLPTASPFAFVCEWPAAGIPLTRTPFDVDSLAEPLRQVRELWRE
jgi:hypothetical protein